jgi:HD domain
VSRADELVETPAERACLDALRAASGDSDGPMERHCVRQFLIAQRLAEDGDLDVDRELLLCASFIHDAGLFPSVASRDSYLVDGRRLFERTLEPFGWPPERMRRGLDAVEQHHATRARWQLGNEVELVRRSDLVDVSGGLVTFGVDRWWVRNLGRELPRRGFYRLLARESWRMLRERPRTIPRIWAPG